MDEMSEQVNELFQRLTFSANRELVHDLYPYVWDVRCVISLLNFYVKWLCKYFDFKWFIILTYLLKYINFSTRPLSTVNYKLYPWILYM